jgi:hypothetical protein
MFSPKKEAISKAGARPSQNVAGAQGLARPWSGRPAPHGPARGPTLRQEETAKVFSLVLLPNELT